MNSRTVTTIVLAVVLMIIVMGVAAALTFTGMAGQNKWTLSEGWTYAAPSVMSMKMTNLTGRSTSELFVQAGNSILIFDDRGKKIFEKSFPGTLASSMGDVDGDEVQDVLAYYATQSASFVEAINAADGETIWQTNVEGLGAAGRAAVVDFSGAGQVGMVIGDMRGKLVALSPTGEELWRYDAAFASDLRGLDNVKAGQSQLVAAADLNGKVVALDGAGKVAWTFNVPGGLRRLRTEEVLGPGQSAALLGSESGTLHVLNGGTGQATWTANLGQPVAEIRLAELDGDAGTRELVLGGTRNGVWAYDQNGKRLFSASVPGEKTKITEIVSMDAEGTGGRHVVAIGDEYGEVSFFDADGHKLLGKSYSAPINRIATGKIGNERQYIVADASQVRALKLSKEIAPFWYTPLLGGLLACVAIAVAAFVIGSMKPAPTLQISAEQMTVEAQKARRIMLHESINDLKRMQQAGEVPSQAYLARLKDLREQLADSEARLIKLGVPLQAETITCPHCGGKLELGTDRCEYCGQTVLT
ncbi:MAG: PQQ-binding-like beta-propeller repeat protein [Thermoflexales bacterium]|nr:PQQ-binding-like beta-propeller repeat protein [Thermoflexales bacterium]